MKKNENYLRYVQAMRLMDEGKSINYIRRRLQIGHDKIKLLRQRYLAGGELALLQPENQHCYDANFKLQVILDVEKNRLPLSIAGLRYDILPTTVGRWLRSYKQHGEAGLYRKQRTDNMQKKRQRTEAELDELEMLRKRNEYLEAENALLKKVKALVEEREARLRAIGQKPSKN